VALVVGDVHDVSACRRAVHDVDVLADAFDLPEDGVERVLQRTIDRVALCGAELVEIREDPFAGNGAGFAAATL
jgi:hypothetical protein